MRITRLKLENWRNFQSVDISLRQRAFFVGANASGKSNLLDALRFMRDIAATQGGGLQSAVARRGGVRALRCLAARATSDVSLTIEIGDDDGPRWRYGLSFGNGKDGAPIVKSETVATWIMGSEDPILQRPDDADTKDPERLTETHLEQISANKDFRAVAEFLRAIAYLHPVPQIMRDPRRFQAADDDYFGGRLLVRISETLKRTREARLKRMNDVLKVAAPQLRDLQLETDADGAPHLKARCDHWRPQGAWQREDQFSDGTLRLLGVVWSLMEKGGPLLLEEPELSLNAGVVSQMAGMIRNSTRRSGRQSLVTTHSADLLGAEGIGLDEVFVLRPGREGTTLESPAEMADVRAMIDAGLPLPDAVLPRTRPEGTETLPLFARDWS